MPLKVCCHQSVAGCSRGKHPRKRPYAWIAVLFAVVTLLSGRAFAGQDHAAPAPGQAALSIVANDAHDATVTPLPDGAVEIHVTGAVPMISVAVNGKLDTAAQRILAFSYFSSHATDHVRLEYVSGGADRIAALPGLSHSEAMSDYTADLEPFSDWPAASKVVRLGFESSPGTVIRIQNIRLRPRTESERTAVEEKAALKAKDEKLRTDLQRYLHTTYPDTIDDVYATAKTLRIRGKLVQDEDVYLAEVPIYEDLTQLSTFDWMAPVHAVHGRFEVTLTRSRTLPDHTYDRIFSKWVLVQKHSDSYSLMSHGHFADEVAARWNLPDETPRSKKGLGGFSAEGPVEDIDALGITSVTVNIFLNFLRSGPGPDRIPFTYGGRQFYADAAEIAKYDKTLRYAASRNLIVSAILLVPKPGTQKDLRLGKLLADPDADPAGIYVMPNVASAEGLQVYAAALNFLAERYSRPDKEFGRIHHWIMHNEVDAGWVWTNAGEKSQLTFMDMYIKSMRTMYLIARQYNPHARVYISLTHFWNWTEDKHFFLPRQMLDELAEFSRQEGDFDWSIAYHPYPESLFKPRTWEDTKVSFGLDSPLITFKNIEVLDAWTKQPSTFYRGQTPRTVFLSEQGFNSESYSAHDLADQAAGLAYAWKKIEHLDSIEAMQYHNWIDNRGEGGLRIGLRKFRDEPGDPLGKKPIWYLYQKLGTPEEDAACEPYKKIIGISDWNAVRYTGPVAGVLPQQTIRDLKSDNWVATDALQRKLPDEQSAGPLRHGRYVGVFYFLTGTSAGKPGPRDVTKTLLLQPDSSKWEKGTYYWGEPEAGYYLSTDEWVIRRHARMLADAGVDVIIFDATNDTSNEPVYSTILRVFESMRRQGELTPQIAFLASRLSIQEVWRDLYSRGLYRDLWFTWKGKPLLLTGQQHGMLPVEQLPSEIQDFFTIRESWAWDSLPWYRNGHDQWPWVAHTPQAAGWHEGPERPEAVSVAVAEHPLSAIGRSFHDGAEPETDRYDKTSVTDKGLYFQEQWDHALAVDPEFVFVTGWNEWMAGSMVMGPDVKKDLARWDFYPGARLSRAGHPLHPGDVYFIDQYNEEFSRDIEPMKGGHTDDYYYQLVANIRRYKGVHQADPVSVATTIDVKGSFDQWKPVTPEFEDHSFDTLPRQSPGNYQAGPYEDRSGRNDFVSMKVARDERNIYFYAKTREPITSFRGRNWMLLFIDSDENKATGWEGYDMVVDAKVIDRNTTTISKLTQDGRLEAPSRIPMRVEGNELMVAVPRALLRQTEKQVSFQFHWADNIAGMGDIAEFSLHGDSAPDRRANYRYAAQESPAALPEAMKASGPRSH